MARVISATLSKSLALCDAGGTSDESRPARVKTVGVVAHPRRNCDEVFAAIVGWARDLDVGLLTLLEVRDELMPSVERVPPDELAASVDLVLA